MSWVTARLPAELPPRLKFTLTLSSQIWRLWNRVSPLGPAVTFNCMCVRGVFRNFTLNSANLSQAPSPKLGTQKGREAPKFRLWADGG